MFFMIYKSVLTVLIMNHYTRLVWLINTTSRLFGGENVERITIAFIIWNDAYDYNFTSIISQCMTLIYNLNSGNVGTFFKFE